MEFYPTVEEAVSSLTLSPEQQDRLYPDLFKLLEVNPEWLAWGEGAVLAVAQDLAQREDYDNLPILGDALQDAGADERTCGLFRTRNRWALKSLLEQGAAINEHHRNPGPV